MKIAALPAPAPAPAPSPTVALSAAARAAATKFEALIVGEMLKAMRTAKLDDGALDSEAESHWTGMRDQQFAQALAERAPIGVATQLASTAK